MNGTRILASVGTFHLRFDRMVDWIEAWRTHNQGAQIVLQHGVSRAMEHAQNHTMMPPAQLLHLMRVSDVVILQGGAGGIMDARVALRVPIVIARTAALGEMVDDHQVSFMTRLDAAGHIHLARSQEHLSHLIDGVLNGSVVTRIENVGVTEGAKNLVTLMDQDIPVLRPRQMLRRLGWGVHQLMRGSAPLQPAPDPVESTPSSHQYGAPHRLDSQPLPETPQERTVDGAHHSKVGDQRQDTASQK